MYFSLNRLEAGAAEVPGGLNRGRCRVKCGHWGCPGYVPNKCEKVPGNMNSQIKKNHNAYMCPRSGHHVVSMDHFLCSEIVMAVDPINLF